MAKAKYKEYVEKMLLENKELFDKFKKIHDKYSENQDELQEEFNDIGKSVMEKVREYESKLCYGSERGGYSQYTSGLAEKFQNEVRSIFPMIDFVGVKVNNTVKKISTFNIKKINL